jgi:hypothetical protein
MHVSIAIAFLRWQEAGSKLNGTGCSKEMAD